MSDPAAVDPGSASTIRVVAGSPTPEELAAVTAVLAGVEAEQAAESAKRLTTNGESAWSESRRALRGPVTPGPGQWRRHHG